MTGEACPFCEHLNPERSRYCNNCGAALYLRPCPHCGELTETVAVRCRSCGGELRASEGAPLRNGSAMALVDGEAPKGDRRPPGEALEAAVDAAEAGMADHHDETHGGRDPVVAAPVTRAPGVEAIELAYPPVGDGCARECHTDESIEAEADPPLDDAPVEATRRAAGSDRQSSIDAEVAAGIGSTAGASLADRGGDARESLREVFAGTTRASAIRDSDGDAGREGDDAGVASGADDRSDDVASPSGNGSDGEHRVVRLGGNGGAQVGTGDDQFPAGARPEPEARAVFELPAPVTGSRRDVAGELQAVAADNDRAAERLGRYAEGLTPIEAAGGAQRGTSALHGVDDLVPPRKPLRRVGVTLLAVGLALSGYGIFLAMTGGAGDDSGASSSGLIGAPGGAGIAPEAKSGRGSSSDPNAPARDGSVARGDAAAPAAGKDRDARTAVAGERAESPSASGSPTPAVEGERAGAPVATSPALASPAATATVPAPASPAATATVPAPASPAASATVAAPASPASAATSATAPAPASPTATSGRAGSTAGRGSASSPVRTVAEGRRVPNANRPPATGSPRTPAAASLAPPAPARTPARAAAAPAAPTSRPCTQAVAALGLCDPRSIQESR